MIRLVSKFPFLQIEKSGYKKIVMNNDKLTDNQKEFIKFVKGILSVNQIPTNKVRFVFTPSFLYDIDGDKINPVYTVMTGGRQKKSIIEIDKPLNTIKIKFIEFVDIDDTDIIKPVVKASRKGIVVYINENVFSGVVGVVNLDICIAEYNQLQENFNYNS